MARPGLRGRTAFSINGGCPVWVEEVFQNSPATSWCKFYQILLLLGFKKHETIKCSNFVTNSSTANSTELYSISLFNSATSNSFSKHGLSHHTNKFYFLPMKVHVLGHIDVHNSIHTQCLIHLVNCQSSSSSWHRMEGWMQCVVWRCQVSAFPCAHCVSIRPRLWRCDTVTVFALLHSWHSITAVTSATPDTRHQHHPSHHLPSSSLGLWYYSRHLISDAQDWQTSDALASCL